MSADAAWVEIVDKVPSRHLTSTLSGVRRELYAPGATGHYLEIGCRLGHSLVMALSGNSRLAVVVDAWIPGYADEPNSGPELVKANLCRWGVDVSRVVFMSGDSHQILPLLLAGQFDTILVDGDHTAEGARQDLEEALRLLAPGGTLLFDDAVPGLLEVWQRTVPVDFWSAHIEATVPYRKAVNG